MVFNSYNFILLFMPIVMVGMYALLKAEMKNLQYWWLLIVSLGFYAFDEPTYLLFLLFDIIANYVFYRIIEKNYNKLFLILGIVFNVLLLLYFKYLNFGIDICNLLIDSNLKTKEIILPLGISFITFQQIAFLVDSYNNKITNKCNLMEYMLFVSFFPHISSGPIIMHDEFFPLIKGNRDVDWEKIASGIYLFFMGLGKKVLIADLLAKGVNYGYSNLNDISTTTGIFISILYTLQIYYDFSGYSDMAIGIARMLQLDLPLNFNSPYKAATIDEFWERWHITLTNFLTKYVYIPLGGSRKGHIRTYVNIIFVFLLSGVWHGASYTFILWGLVHGVLKVFSRFFSSLINIVPRWINHIVTLIIINFTWVLFRVGSLQKLKEYIFMLLRNDWSNVDINVTEAILPKYIVRFLPEYYDRFVIVTILLFIIILITLFAPNTQEVVVKRKFSIAKIIWMIVVGVLSILSMSGVSTFIYAYF